VQSRVDVYLSGLIMFHVGCAGQEGGLQEGVGPFKGVGVEAGVELLPALRPPTVCVVHAIEEGPGDEAEVYRVVQWWWVGVTR
jgi:hypothetical protein